VDGRAREESAGDVRDGGGGGRDRGGRLRAGWDIGKETEGDVTVGGGGAEDERTGGKDRRRDKSKDGETER
jgi:hypothetical protein